MIVSYYLLFFWCLSLSVGRKLPSFVRPCKKDDPELNKCMTTAFMDIRPYYREGIPEMKLPSLNPFHVSKVELTSPSLNLILTNLSVFGLDDFYVKDLEMDLSNNTIAIKVFTPFVRYCFNYTASGKLSIMELRGSGYGEANFTDVHYSIKLSGQRIERHGKFYLALEVTYSHLDVNDGRFRLDDIINNNPMLTARTNEVINENALEFIKEMKPISEKAIGSISSSIIKTVFDRYSLDELFM